MNTVRPIENAFNKAQSEVSQQLGAELGYLVMGQEGSELALDGQVTIDTLDRRRKFVETSSAIVGHLVGAGLVDLESLKNHLRGDN